MIYQKVDPYEEVFDPLTGKTWPNPWSYPVSIRLVGMWILGSNDSGDVIYNDRNYRFINGYTIGQVGPLNRDFGQPSWSVDIPAYGER